MQEIESHTIVYLRTLLSIRAVDDRAIAASLACWVYEETFHGRALARFLAAAGHAVPGALPVLGRGGRAAARRVDERIRRLPGFTGVALLEAWIDGAADPAPVAAATVAPSRLAR